ncbi:hypothetical protein Tco_0653018 [Tanacetum coccineum]|uniref:Uncharacterized protein n=1 Tax=Tanacetum coccineum TaxID=301880 RepID=A0ABQ4WZ98_9ASTR
MSLRSFTVLPDGKIEQVRGMVDMCIRFCTQPDGVGSKRYHIVPYGELNGIPLSLVARFGVIFKSADSMGFYESVLLGMRLITTVRLKPEIRQLAIKDEYGFIQRISLTGFPAQSVGSSAYNMTVLDSQCLLVLITGTSQSRQHGLRLDMIVFKRQLTLRIEASLK